MSNKRLSGLFLMTQTCQNMKFNREQQRELKKIDAAFEELKSFSVKGNTQADFVLLEYAIPNIYEQQLQALNQRNRSRQEVFEMSRKKSDKAKLKS